MVFARRYDAHQPNRMSWSHPRALRPSRAVSDEGPAGERGLQFKPGVVRRARSPGLRRTERSGGERRQLADDGEDVRVGEGGGPVRGGWRSHLVVPFVVVPTRGTLPLRHGRSSGGGRRPAVWPATGPRG